jgi:hypothetical protein
MEIKKIAFKDLRGEAHYEFMVVLDNLLNKFYSVMTLVAMFYSKFTELRQKESQLIDAAKKSSLTERLADVDKRIDDDVFVINNIVKAMMRHFNAATAEAARELNIRLKNFGNIRQKSYKEESAAVQLLVRDLQTTFAQQVQILGLTELVADLGAAETEFTARFEQRNTEEANRPQEKMNDIRKEIENEYKKMITAIQNDINVNGDANCGEFTTKLNMEIKYFNEHARHRTKRNINEATVESIADQNFSEQQIIIIPIVWYEHKQLIFATDFYVSYKNNIMPGNAELTIHGIGKFKGKKIITFNIVELRIEKQSST